MKPLDIETFRKNCIACAVLDMLCEPEWEIRRFSYDPAWDDNEQMGSWRDGSGCQLFNVFHSECVFVKGINPDSVYGGQSIETGNVPPELLNKIQAEDMHFLEEPAFGKECSFLFTASKKISVPNDLDFPLDKGGLADVFKILTEGIDAYLSDAEAYFERELPFDLCKKIFSFERVTFADVKPLVGRRTWKTIEKELCEIGYSPND
ncbi:hypothetical protein ACO0LM_22270 [Undibacterium sp. Di26W]|uniref:hypothetical protein n=1 Tax=Undibacterium sp. Di26W TaxID=3413035 RepID=UPI003BEFBE7E